MGTIITLCTDFGTRDGYVGAMKGVLLSIAPQATLVDIAHDIPRQSVAEGALPWRRLAATFQRAPSTWSWWTPAWAAPAGRLLCVLAAISLSPRITAC
jgi:hypothetical protein